MIVEFDKSFEKWLAKINDGIVLEKIEKAILQIEAAQSINQVHHIKKLSGFQNYYRIKLGSYRMGFERISKTTIRLIIVDKRKDIYKRFP